MSRHITHLEREGHSIDLYIEPYTFPDDISLTDTWGITTDCYELGGKGSEMQFKHNLKHSTNAVKGTAFRLVADGPVEVSVACILTEWVHDDDGELEEIIVPDEPYDTATVTLEPGDYRVWDEKS